MEETVKRFSLTWWQGIVDLADLHRKSAMSFPAKARLTNIYYYAKLRFANCELE